MLRACILRCPIEDSLRHRERDMLWVAAAQPKRPDRPFLGVLEADLEASWRRVTAAAETNNAVAHQRMAEGTIELAFQACSPQCEEKRTAWADRFPRVADLAGGASTRQMHLGES